MERGREGEGRKSEERGEKEIKGRGGRGEGKGMRRERKEGERVKGGGRLDLQVATSAATFVDSESPDDKDF